MPGRMQPTGVSVPGLFVMKEQTSKRDRNRIEPDQKTRVERETDKLTGETLRAMCREKVIPKKMRWIIGQKIADLVNDFHTSVNIANGIKVRSHDEFVERHKFQTLALAYLKATDTKMTLALDVMELNADYFETWAGQYNETLRQIQGWLTKDEKRYSERFGPLSPEEESYIAGSIPVDIRESADFTPSGFAPNPSNANNVRNSNPDGSLNNNNANNTNGVSGDRENASTSKQNC